MSAGKEKIFEFNHQLQFIADSIPVHLNYLDLEGRFVYANKSACDWWGLGLTGIIGKTIRELVGEDAYPEFRRLMDRVFSGETVHHEASFDNKDGTVGYFSNCYIPDFDEAGKVIGFVATGTDVTEKFLALQKATKLATEFRTLADSMPQIVWTANPDGFVDYYNKRWYEFTGLPEGSADNSLWASIIHPEDIDSTLVAWYKALASGEPYETEIRVRDAKSGVFRWLLTRARPVKDEHGKVIKWYGSNTDIHDQKMIQMNLELEKDLRERFVSTLTHDLRTPLTAAKISSQLIARKNSDPAIQKLSFRIEENMDRADRMIQDLLDVSVVKAGQQLPIRKVQCHLTQLLKKVIEEYSIINGDRFTLQAPMDVTGNWDCEAIRRISENLLSNAIKYGQPHTVVKVSVTKNEKEAELSVNNAGRPIPASELSGLFDTYTRSASAVHGNHKGWGIGLSLVKGLTEAHGGSVRVSSSSEAGTTFTVTLPCT